MAIAQKRILVVEDEPHLAFNLEFNLSSEGYMVVLATNGRSALAAYHNQGPFDLLILDGMLPEVDGLEVARQIRAKDSHTGILMLTARAAEADIVAGLETGVDDYMTKPFHLQELLLRVRRMAERAELLQPMEPRVALIVGSLQLDTESLELISPSGRHSLTALESGILSEFMQNPGRVLSREYLLRQVWGTHGQIETRTVDNFVMRIRRYIECDPSHPCLIESVRGRGYRFRPDHAEPAKPFEP